MALWVSVLAAAVAVRWWTLSGQPYEFHSTRQLYDMLMARGFWAELGGTPPDGTLAAVTSARSPALEPPITQGFAAVVYLAVGHEAVGLVRAALAVVWAAAAASVFRTVHLATGSRGPAYAAAAVWLFLPFGVILSRSFQPDGLMLASIAWAVHALVRSDLDRGRGRWSATLASSCAVFVKAPAAFFVVPVYLALRWSRDGLRGTLRRDTAAHLFFTLAPSLVFLLSRHFTEAMQEQERGSFLPQLVLHGWFWSGWWHMAISVVGLFGLPVIALGLIVSRGRLRVVLAALLAGYVALGLAFTYHYATHDYYHAPLLLVLALAVASVVSWAQSAGRTGALLPRPVLVGVAAGLLLDVTVSPSTPRVFVGPPESWTSARDEAEEIGEQLDHDTAVVFLSADYGHGLEEYGYLSGVAWPSRADHRKEELQGRPHLDVRARLAELSRGGELHWFVVTEPDELAAQPELEAYLGTVGAPLRGDGWVAYRLGGAGQG